MPSAASLLRAIMASEDVSKMPRSEWLRTMGLMPQYIRQ